MRVVFFGTPSFAASILEFLVQNTHHEIVAVVSKPDKPQGRNLELKKTAVKELSERILPHVPLLQPVKASTPDFIESLRPFQADLFLVVAYGEIIKPTLLELPKLGCFNVHGSLLPLYRGAAPVQRVLYDGCQETGITFMRMDKGLDSGDIVLQKSCKIDPNENATSLFKKLEKVSCECVQEGLSLLETGKATFSTQDHAKATFAQKILNEELKLSENENVLILHNKIRAFSTHPGGYFVLHYKNLKKRLKVLASSLHMQNKGTSRHWMVKDKKLALETEEGTLILEKVQPEGKAVMTSEEFLRGHSFSELSFE